MSPQDLARRVRELESQDLFAAAAELRWAASRAVSGSVVPAQSVSPPALTGDDDPASSPSCHLAAALRDAEALGDERSVSVLLSALAGLERPSRRAA